jgi:NTE family protein
VDGGVLNNFPEPLSGQCDIIIGNVNSIKNEVDQVHMNNVMDRCFHLAMKGSVQSKIDSCSLYIEPPNMSQFSIFNLKRDEIFDYGYQYTYFRKTDKRTQPLGSRNLKIVLSIFATWSKEQML